MLELKFTCYVLQVQLNTTGIWYYADYATFSLDSEENKYAIRVSGFSGNAGDSLTNTSVPSLTVPEWNELHNPGCRQRQTSSELR